MVELVMTVTILSILLIVGAVSVSHYSRRSMEFDAKVNLAQAHSAQESHYAACETYFPDLIAIGMRLEGKTHYNVGGKFNTTNFSKSSCADRARDCTSTGVTTKKCRNFLIHNKNASDETTQTATPENICSVGLDQFKKEKHKSCYFPKKESIIDLGSYIDTVPLSKLSEFTTSAGGKNIKVDQYMIFAGRIVKVGTPNVNSVFAINEGGHLRKIE